PAGEPAFAEPSMAWRVPASLSPGGRRRGGRAIAGPQRRRGRVPEALAEHHRGGRPGLVPHPRGHLADPAPPPLPEQTRRVEAAGAHVLGRAPPQLALEGAEQARLAGVEARRELAHPERVEEVPLDPGDGRLHRRPALVDPGSPLSPAEALAAEEVHLLD